MNEGIVLELGPPPFPWQRALQCPPGRDVGVDNAQARGGGEFSSLILPGGQHGRIRPTELENIR